MREGSKDFIVVIVVTHGWREREREEQSRKKSKVNGNLWTWENDELLFVSSYDDDEWQNELCEKKTFLGKL